MPTPNDHHAVPTPKRSRRRRQRPGALTSEFWSVVGAMTASLTVCLQAEEAGVRITGIVALASVGCVLGGIYIWSRTRVKTP